MRILSEKEWRAERREEKFFGPPSVVSPYWAGRLAHMLDDPRSANPCDPSGPWYERWDAGWADRAGGIDPPLPPKEPIETTSAPAAASPIQLALNLQPAEEGE